jgi:DNA helicase HerA-like ATPase
LPFVVTAEEASTFFRLPIGSPLVSAGFVVNKAGKDGKTYADGIINAGDITVGSLKSSARGDTIGFSLRDLTKHMLVVGTPGSGKTTFSVGLLDRLWKQHHMVRRYFGHQHRWSS